MKRKRNLFAEMMDGVQAIKAHRQGKITLRTHKIETEPRVNVGPDFFVNTREELHASRSIFARRLRINERTLEKWEQGRAKPNQEAVALVGLVREYPDTLERLDRVFKKL